MLRGSFKSLHGYKLFYPRARLSFTTSFNYSLPSPLRRATFNTNATHHTILNRAMSSLPLRNAVILSDLDGTLLPSKVRSVSAAIITTLQRLGELGATRAVVTGRNYHSTQKVLQADFPIDYLIFSSGAGIVDWKSKQIVESHNLDSTLMTLSAEYLRSLNMDFFVHHPVPDNHMFHFIPSATSTPPAPPVDLSAAEASPTSPARTGSAPSHVCSNPDFYARIALLREHGQLLELQAAEMKQKATGDPTSSPSPTHSTFDATTEANSWVPVCSTSSIARALSSEPSLEKGACQLIAVVPPHLFRCPHATAATLTDAAMEAGTSPSNSSNAEQASVCENQLPDAVTLVAGFRQGLYDYLEQRLAASKHLVNNSSNGSSSSKSDPLNSSADSNDDTVAATGDCSAKEADSVPLGCGGLGDAPMSSHVTVIHTSSPLDHRSIWVEIFPGHVGKGVAARRLIVHHLGLQLQALPPQTCAKEETAESAESEKKEDRTACVVAIGNDFNDVCLLDFASSLSTQTASTSSGALAPASPRAFVVAGAPPALRARKGVHTVAACEADGFCEAMTRVFPHLADQLLAKDGANAQTQGQMQTR